MNLLNDPWSSAENSNINNSNGIDTKLRKVQETLKSLEETSPDPWTRMALLTSEEDSNEALFEELSCQVKKINDASITGITLLIYCVVFDKSSYIELLHEIDGLDPNVPDRIYENSPLTWCFDLERKNCLLELLNFSDELDFSYKNPGGSTALQLLVPGSAMYEFAKDRGLFRLVRDDFKASNDLYGAPTSGYTNTDVDNTLDQINLQTAGLGLNDDSVSVSLDTGKEYTQSSDTSPIGGEEPLFRHFDFDHVLPKQYIEFADYDIPRLLDLIISIPARLPHKPCVPAAIIFQSLRYADCVKESPSLVNSMAHLSLTKILTSLSSTSGGALLASQSGDIISQSYWLSSLTFLFYYLYRQDGFFKRYPSILQEMIDAMRSLVIEMNSSIHSRIEPLIDSTILEHTTIAEVKETLYKKDWNLLKKRKLRKRKNGTRDSYDQIMAMLYPPSLDEQRRLSPIKVVQIFGALLYVLDLHQVHPLIAQQCLSLAINWFSVTLFNKIMENKKKSLSRAHAIQIKLNLSVIQDWIKNHDFKPSFPSLMDDFMFQKFPYTLIFNLGDIGSTSKPFELRNVTFYRPIEGDITNDMNNSLFFYQSFYQISRIHLEPCMQLLQWLQVATSLEDEESFDSTVKLLNKLTPLQLYKSMSKYRYEVEENKFASSLRKKLSMTCKQRDEVEPYLPEKALCSLALPTITELIESFTQNDDSDELLPLLPLDVQDDVDEIHEQNVKLRDQETEKSNQSRLDDDLSSAEEDDGSQIENANGDQLFKKLDAPSSAAQRPLWAITDDIEQNPW
ncbi:LAFA_0G10528g1_1 [Lachancea sp. 'fantastica']|nr:LAFA_0G10528g1_1 [Lachancea sp. 'fantastica']